ncbi:MAG: uracil-DNA glycosylase family protein [Haloarculaceae archaeon]
MDANQDALANPFGMDEDCRNCPALCETRTQVVHGYGDVGADFVVVGESPDPGVDETGIPFAGEERVVLESLDRLGFVDDADADEPETENVFLTYVTRCRHPDRPATDEEVRNCEGYLNSELRMINPEIIVPVGQRALAALAFEYTTERAEDLDAAELHATTLRGRGFELVPMRDPADLGPEETEAFVEHLADILGTDYRQTKGRRGSVESGRGPDDGG